MLRNGEGMICGRSGSTRVHSCVNPPMNREHRQLDVPYISTIIKPLVRTEVSISVAAIQAAVS